MILDYEFLGSIPDPLDSEDTTEEVNEDLLFVYDQLELIKSVGKRLSVYELEFLLQNTAGSDKSFWLRVLLEIINIYSLNSLKQYLYNEYLFDPMKDVRKLLILIKIKLTKKIEEDKIDQLNRQSLLELIDSIKYDNKLLKDAIIYIDKESLNKFTSTILYESTLDYQSVI